MLDLLIVGAGPSGLALAVEAARHGVSFRVVEKRAAPSEHSRALGVQPRTVEVFDAWGVAEEAIARGLAARGAHVHVDGERIAGLEFAGLESPYPFLLVLAQSDTERILEAALERLGARVERGVELQGLDVGDDGAEARLRHADGREEVVHARWVGGCDGAHSPVRHALGLPFEGAAYPEQFLLADVAVEWDLPHDEFHGFFAGREILASVPMAGPDRYRLITIREEETDAPPTVAEFEAALARVARIEARLSDPVWLAAFRVHRRMAPRFRHGAAFLLGDAAHIHSPVGGQGMNTGIQDAWNLGWKLGLVAAGAAGPELLDTYDAERRPVARGILEATDRATNLLLGRTPAARLARSLGPRVALSLPPVVARARRELTQIAIHYRESSIVGEAEGASFDGGPEPGERAPDAVLSPRGQPPVRVFDLLRGAAHVLLAWGVEEVPPGLARAARAALDGRLVTQAVPAAGGDADGEAARVYGVEGPCLHLLRPDGHLGWRGPLDPAPLARFLTRYR